MVSNTAKPDENSWVNPSIGSQRPIPVKRPGRSCRDRFLQVLMDFCDQTNMHGLGQVATHTIIIIKVIWFLAFLGAQAGLWLHISDLIIMYRDYPIQQSTNIDHTPVQFPEVTVCNLDPISQSNYENVSKQENGTLAMYLARLEGMYNNGTISQAELSTLGTPINIMRNAGMEESRMVGHQLRDLILRCTFRAQPCNMTSQFTYIMNPILYNCYTFNPGIAGNDFVATGPENGLSLLFYLEETNGSTVQATYSQVHVIMSSFDHSHVFRTTHV